MHKAEIDEVNSKQGNKGSKKRSLVLKGDMVNNNIGTSTAIVKDKVEMIDFSSQTSDEILAYLTPAMLNLNNENIYRDQIVKRDQETGTNSSQSSYYYDMYSSNSLSQNQINDNIYYTEF